MRCLLWIAVASVLPWSSAAQEPPLWDEDFPYLRHLLLASHAEFVVESTARDAGGAQPGDTLRLRAGDVLALLADDGTHWRVQLRGDEGLLRKGSHRPLVSLGLTQWTDLKAEAVPDRPPARDHDITQYHGGFLAQVKDVPPSNPTCPGTGGGQEQYHPKSFDFGPYRQLVDPTVFSDPLLLEQQVIVMIRTAVEPPTIEDYWQGVPQLDLKHYGGAEAMEEASSAWALDFVALDSTTPEGIQAAVACLQGLREER